MQRLPKRIVLSLLPDNGEDALKLLGQARGPDTLVELRGDLLSADEWKRTIEQFSDSLLVAIRRPSDGGVWPGSERSRIDRLKLAQDLGVRWIDVESDAEWRPWERPSGGVSEWIVSDHGLPCQAPQLHALWQRLRQLPVSGVKIVPLAESISDNVAIYELLRSRNEADPALIAFAMGQPGRVSRLLAAAHGSPWHYAARTMSEVTAPGQFSADLLQTLYRPFEIDDQTRLFGLLGASLMRSPSPAMHQAQFDAAGLNARYLPFEVDSFEAFLQAWENSSLGNLEAVGVTMPFKEAAAGWAQRLDPWAERTGAVNTLTRQAGQWVGWNTDAPAACEWAQQTFGELAAVRVRVVGSGGTARALAAALGFAKADVELVARDDAKSRRVAEAIGAKTRPWKERDAPGWDLLVQATPLGGDGERWFDPEALTGKALLDAVYRSGGTALSQDAAERGLSVWSGLDLLVGQGQRQYALMTGQQASADRLYHAAETFLSRLGPKSA